MTLKNAKTISFAVLIVALILPVLAMSLADAAPNEKANDKAKEKVHEPEPPTMEEMKANLDKPPRERQSHVENDKFFKYPPPQDHSKGHLHEDHTVDESFTEFEGFTAGTGHIGFGTGLDVDTSSQVGVYFKNEVHDSGITLEDNTILYAPTVLPANNSPVEVVTSYVDKGFFSGTEKKVVLYNHVTGTFDWDDAFVIDSNFINDYTLSVSGSDYYYTYVYKSGSNWAVYIYDVANTQWDLWDVISGTGPYSDGWVAWEEYYFDGSCPTTLPEIKARGVQVYDGGWQNADSSYASEHDDGSICGITNATFQSDFDEWSVDD